MLSVFVFVFIWHGCRDFTAIWVSINAMALMLETFARLFTLYLASFQVYSLCGFIYIYIYIYIFSIII